MNLGCWRSFGAGNWGSEARGRVSVITRLPLARRQNCKTTFKEKSSLPGNFTQDFLLYRKSLWTGLKLVTKTDYGIKKSLKENNQARSAKLQLPEKENNETNAKLKGGHQPMSNLAYQPEKQQRHFRPVWEKVIVKKRASITLGEKVLLVLFAAAVLSLIAFDRIEAYAAYQTNIEVQKLEEPFHPKAINWWPRKKRCWFKQSRSALWTHCEKNSLNLKDKVKNIQEEWFKCQKNRI